MSPRKKERSRLEFLEDGNNPVVADEFMAPPDVVVSYPVLGKYDFTGTGPRPGVKRDVELYNHASTLKTRGEDLSPILIRIGWILVRLAIGFAILYFFLQGNTFNCMGGDVSFT